MSRAPGLEQPELPSRRAEARTAKKAAGRAWLRLAGPARQHRLDADSLRRLLALSGPGRGGPPRVLISAAPLQVPAPPGRSYGRLTTLKLLGGLLSRARALRRAARHGDWRVRRQKAAGRRPRWPSALGPGPRLCSARLAAGLWWPVTPQVSGVVRFGQWGCGLDGGASSGTATAGGAMRPCRARGPAPSGPSKLKEALS